MDSLELVRVVLENGDKGWELLKSNWDPAKAIPIAFAALGFLWGVYIKWRNTGYRMLDRLEEFMEQQEKRVDGTREELAGLVQTPGPDIPVNIPVFSSHKLTSKLRKMNWGYGYAAVNNLEEATRVCENQSRLSSDVSNEHKRRKALAHLLLGARAASRDIADIEKRNEARATALSHFDKALELDANDTDALEYSGMMLLDLANPAGALERFNKLVSLRQSKGGFGLAKAYRLQATAYESLPRPMYGNASNALIEAIKYVPQDMLMERARTHEQHGLVRTELRRYGVANESLGHAMTIYSQLRKTHEGKAGLDRVNAAIGRLNQLQNVDGAPPLQGPMDGPSTAATLSARKPWLEIFKPNKPTG